VASRSKKSSKSKRREPESAAATLDEIQSLGDKIAAWVGRNPLPVLGTAVAILVVAAAWGLIASHIEGTRVDASAALAEVQAEYRLAMGADPSALEVVEPANPETARRVRSEFVERFQEVAQDYAGTASGALARLEAGGLQQELEQTGEAVQTWQLAADELAADDPIRALLLMRIAASQEAEMRWIEAAETYQEAAAIERYPLRYGALADAARCFAEAGERDRALETFDRIENEAPQQRVPEHINARMRELRAQEHLD
jgi:tetratricopeptide (TPR) repeat protein